MKIYFHIADKSPLLYEDAIVTRKEVEITKISKSVIEYCASRYLAILLQEKYRNGLGDYGKLNIAGEEVNFKEI